MGEINAGFEAVSLGFSSELCAASLSLVVYITMLMMCKSYI